MSYITHVKYKKVLLFNPKKPEPGTTPMHFGDMRPPMGLGYIATVLDESGIEAKIIDNYVNPQSTCDEISQFDPDLIGMYMNSPGYFQGIDLIDEIKECTDVPLIIGGPQANILPETIPNKVDHIVKGEGEHVMLSMCQGKRWLNKIIDNRQNRIENLDCLPFPDYKFFIDKPYNLKFGNLFGEDRHPIMTMHTSRSCPFDCSFCGVSSIWTRKYTKFSSNKILNEIENLIKKYGTQGIYFREDLFTCDRNRLYEFCKGAIERSLDIIWACEARADIQSKELLDLMYRSGCRGLYVGVESGSDEGLKKKSKGLSKKDIRNFFKLTKESGIGTYATFCLGTPGETDEEINETLTFIDEIRPTSVDKFPYLGLPRSRDYDTLLRTGDYYHIDESGIIYTERFYDLMNKMYDSSDHRIHFLDQQRKFLDENRGRISDLELRNHRFNPIVDYDMTKSQTTNEVIVK